MARLSDMAEGSAITMQSTMHTQDHAKYTGLKYWLEKRHSTPLANGYQMKH